MFGRLRNLGQGFKRDPKRGTVIIALFCVIGFFLFQGAGNLWAWHNFTKAEEAIKHGTYEEAEKYLRCCLTFWPRNAQAHFWMARASRWLGKFEEAEEHLDRCEALDWSPLALERERALVSAQQGAFAALESILLAWAQEKDADAAPVQEGLVQLYAQNSQVQPALYWGDRFLQRFPDHVAVLKTMAFLYRRTKNRADSLKCYRRVVAIQPDNMEVREAFAAALLETFEPREAYRQYQWLASRQPESVSFLLGLARSLRDLGEPAEARRVLEDLLAKHPQEEVALGEFGQLAWREGRAAEAEKWLKKALAIYPYHIKNLYTLYLSLKSQNKTREAQQYYARYKRVAADVERLDYLSLTKIVKEPHNPEIPYEIGVICMRNANTEVGVSWLKKALKLSPWHPGANEALASYYAEIGNQPLAAKYRRWPQGQIASGN